MNRWRLELIRYGVAALLAAGAGAGVAAEFPDRPVIVVVPTPAGGPVDRVTRILAQGMQKQLGQPVVVENRIGASGKIGVQTALRASHDGYTLIAVSPSITSVNPVVDKAAGYDPIKDFEWLGIAASNAGVLAVRSGLPVASVADLVRYAKAHPDGLTYASFGVGTSLHLQSEELLQTLGITARHIPYKGEAQALNALVSGEVDMMAYVTASVVPFVETGRIHALATTSSHRWAMLPNVVSYAESVPELQRYEYNSWVGLVVPKGVPAEHVKRLGDALRGALAAGEVRNSLQSQGFDIGAGAPDSMRTTVTQELDRNRRLLAAGRVKLD